MVAVMPWGKHRGTPIDQCPHDYLIWVVKNADALRPELKKEIEDELGLRPGQAGVGFNLDSSAPKSVEEVKAENAKLRKILAETRRYAEGIMIERDEAKKELKRAISQPLNNSEAVGQLTKKWFRTMSMRFHPDRGGSQEQQMVLNACYHELKKIINEGVET